MSSSPPWDPYCPQGGRFYACGNNTKFVGCCDYTNPCVEEGGCSAGNLRQTSFPVAKYGTFSDQQCSAGLFYTCTGVTPDAFWGCCSINPCANNGCPRTALEAAFLSNNPASAADMDPYPPLAVTSSSTSSTLSTSSTSSPTSSAIASGTSAAAVSTATPESKSSPVGAIAGGAAGGAAFLIAIIAIIWMVRRHAKKSRESRANTGFGPTSEIPEAYGGNDHDKTAMAQVTTMGSPYKDSPSTVPPYSTQPSPAPVYQPGGWPTQPMQPQGYTQGYPVHEAEARSQFKPYSPTDQSGKYPPHGHPHQHPQFSPSLSQISDPMQSTTWTNTNSSMGVPPRVPVSSQYGNPPQEMEGGGYGRNYTPTIGLGVHHIGDSFASEAPRAELEGRTSSPTPTQTQTQTHSRTDGSRV